MKKLALFTNRPEISNIYFEDLRLLFDGYLELHHYALNQGEIPSKSQLEHADILLISNEEIINKVHHLIGKKSRIIMVDFSYPEINIEKMKEYPAGTYALACFNPFICRKMVNLFYEQGVNNLIWMFPQDKGEIPISGYDIAVIDDYSPCKIPEDKEIIYLGKRKLAFSTLLKIAQESGILNEKMESSFLKYCYSYKSATSLVNTIYGDMSSFHSQVRLILNYIDSGIMILDEKLKVIEYNSHFLDLFQLNQELYGKILNEIPGMKKLLPYIGRGLPVRNELIVYPDIHSSLVLNLERIDRGLNQGCNYMLILQEVGEIEDKSHLLKRQLKIKGYTSKYHFSDLITDSPEMKACIKKAERIATIDKTTLIVGESGTGKELIAQSIHSASKRKKYPFVSINCAAILPSLLESELFGYAEGAFTGSKKGGKSGLFEMANYGTLFLDEIGEASIEVQSKLLRAIETKEIMRVGGDKILSVDVRILAATNQNLKKLVEEKKFRLDLYYRLNAVIIRIPPLRERKNDVLYLAEYFIRQEAHGKREVKPELWNFLEQYSWQGNVRELKNVVEYMVDITDGPLTLKELPDYIAEDYVNFIEKDGGENGGGEEISSERTERKTENGTWEKADLEKGIMEEYGKLSELYSGREIRLIGSILRWVLEGARSRMELVRRAAEEGEAVSDYRMRKLLDDIRKSGMISYSRGPEGIFLEKKGRDFIKISENT